MSFDSHLRSWMGLPVEAFPQEGPYDFERIIYRVEMIPGRGLFRRTKEITGRQMLERYFSEPGCEAAPALILGLMEGGGELSDVTPLLSANKEKLPNLKGLFLSDIIQEENESSWIIPCDVAFVFSDFPGLEDLRLRSGHTFAPARHLCLKSLIIEGSGLSSQDLANVASSVFPELEHLELYLGGEEYGGDCKLEDVKPLLEPGRFPKLKSLGLRNSELVDQIARELAQAPILEQLERLDLSLGTLSDEGGEALLASEGIRTLGELDLHYNFLSEATIARFHELSLAVDVSENDPNGDEERYVAVSE